MKINSSHIVFILVLALLSGCTNQLDSADDKFKLPFATNDKQRLVRMIDEFCAPDDQMAPPEQLPRSGRFVIIPSVLWQEHIAMHIFFAAQNYGIRRGANRVNIPAKGILVAEPDAPVPPALMPAMFDVGGIEIADTANADAILQSVQNLRHQFLFIRDLKIGKAGVDAINRMPNLQALWMYGVNSDSLQSLNLSRMHQLAVKAIDPNEQLSLILQNNKSVDQLTDLNLCDSAISDSMLKAVGKMPNLKHLSFDGSALSDSQLIPLLPRCNLQELCLHDTGITDQSLKSLGSQTRLQVLNISRCAITDAGLLTLAKLPNLKKIDLCFTSVSDRGILILSRSPSLNSLFLANTAISPACLPRFTAFKSLTHISLGHDNLPVEAIQRLARQMPQCTLSQ